jgi:hypothetical protein
VNVLYFSFYSYNIHFRCSDFTDTISRDSAGEKFYGNVFECKSHLAHPRPRRTRNLLPFNFSLLIRANYSQSSNFLLFTFEGEKYRNIGRTYSANRDDKTERKMLILEFACFPTVIFHRARNELVYEMIKKIQNFSNRRCRLNLSLRCLE